MSFQSQADVMLAGNAARRHEAYQRARLSTPAAGMQMNFHGFLFGQAHRAVRAGIAEEMFVKDVLHDLPQGKRQVTDTEIRRTYRSAALGKGRPPPDSVAHPMTPCFRPELLQHVIAEGGDATLEDILRKSPEHIPDAPSEQQKLLLSALFREEECLFTGPWFGKEVQPLRYWLDRISRGETLGPFLCVNPLSGLEQQSKSGTLSRRADACVSAYRHCLIEFDGLSIDQQAKFWFGVDLPVAAIVHSGNKSLHAILRVDVPDMELWKSDIEGKLFGERLGVLGVDTACKNPARLCRMAGFTREDTGQVQKLLYLAPSGKAVGA